MLGCITKHTSDRVPVSLLVFFVVSLLTLSAEHIVRGLKKDTYLPVFPRYIVRYLKCNNK